MLLTADFHLALEALRGPARAVSASPRFNVSGSVTSLLPAAFASATDRMRAGLHIRCGARRAA